MDPAYYYLIGSMILLAGALFLLRKPAVIEKFGGQVKKIRHIPFNNCASICEGYYRKCVVDNPNDVMWCQERFREACVAECRYSKYHRM